MSKNEANNAEQPNIIAPQAATTDTKTLRFWQLLCLLFAVSTTVFAYIAFVVRTVSTKSSTKNNYQKRYEATETQAWNFLSRHLNNNEATEARKQLIIWFSVLQNSTINSLDEAAAYISDTDLINTLKKFDESLYGNSNNEENTQQLLKQLTEYRKQQLKKHKVSDKDESRLADFHPTKA